MDVYVLSQPSGGGSITTHGGGLHNLTSPAGQRSCVSLSGVITGLAPGTYIVGIGGTAPTIGNPWNSNSRVYTSALLLN